MTYAWSYSPSVRLVRKNDVSHLRIDEHLGSFAVVNGTCRHLGNARKGSVRAGRMKILAHSRLYVSLNKRMVRAHGSVRVKILTNTFIVFC
jgi:hypothetical protein